MLQRLVGSRQRMGLAKQIDEHANLRSQDVGVHRLGEIVDRPGTIAADDITVVDQVRGEEQDRHVLRPPPTLDDLRQLEAADAGHPDVEHDAGELLIEQRQQRLVSRLRPHDATAGRRQSQLERLEIGALVVDDQDLRHVGRVRPDGILDGGHR